MAAASDYLENKVNDHVWGGGDYVRPATVYVALFTSAPTDAGGGTEVTGGSYARAAVTNNTTNFPASAAGAKANAAAISFATATAAWGTITHIGVFDALTAGNLLVHAALSAPKTIQNGDTFSLSIGALTVSVS